MEIGERVRRLRGERSQADVAEACGVSQQSIDALEKGLVARPRYLPQLAVALETTIEYLLGQTTDPVAPKVVLALDAEILLDTVRQVWPVFREDSAEAAAKAIIHIYRTAVGEKPAERAAFIRGAVAALKAGQ